MIDPNNRVQMSVSLHFYAPQEKTTKEHLQGLKGLFPETPVKYAKKNKFDLQKLIDDTEKGDKETAPHLNHADSLDKSSVADFIKSALSTPNTSSIKATNSRNEGQHLTQGIHVPAHLFHEFMDERQNDPETNLITHLVSGNDGKYAVKLHAYTNNVDAPNSFDREYVKGKVVYTKRATPDEAYGHMLQMRKDNVVGAEYAVSRLEQNHPELTGDSWKHGVKPEYKKDDIEGGEEHPIAYSKAKDEESPFWKATIQQPENPAVADKYGQYLEDKDDARAFIVNNHGERLADKQELDPTEYESGKPVQYCSVEGKSGVENWQVGSSKNKGMFVVGYNSPFIKKNSKDDGEQAHYRAEMPDVVLHSFLMNLPESHSEVASMLSKFVPAKYKFSKLISDTKVKFTPKKKDLLS